MAAKVHGVEYLAVLHHKVDKRPVMCAPTLHRVIHACDHVICRVDGVVNNGRAGQQQITRQLRLEGSTEAFIRQLRGRMKKITGNMDPRHIVLGSHEH